jgi:hypothetical protein
MTYVLDDVLLELASIERTAVARLAVQMASGQRGELFRGVDEEIERARGQLLGRPGR